MTSAPAVAAVRLNGRHWFVFAVCAIGFFFDSMDLQIMSLVAPQLLRDWTLSPQQIGLITSSGMVGMLIGSVLFGVFSDRIGRRPGFQLTVAVFACFSVLGALAQDPAQLMVCRVLAGLGIGGFVPIDTALLTEFVPARWRGRLIALWAIAFPAGGLAAAGLVPLVLPAFGWRGAFLLGFAPVLLIPVVRRWLPETPRFLLSAGKVEQARRSVDWISAGAEVVVEEDDAPAPSPAAGLFAPAQRRGTLLASLLWFGWSFAYFGVILWLPTLLVLMRVPLAEVFLYTLGFQLAAIAGRVVTLLFADRVSRPALIVVTGLCAAAAMLVFGAQHAMVWLVITGYTLSFFQDGGFSGIVPYTPELFPTRLRATGVGAANGAGRLASMIAPLVIGMLVQAGSTYPVFIVFAGCYLGAVAVIVLLGNGTRTHLSRT